MGEFETLGARVEGPVLVPGDAGYERELAGYQTGWRHRPAVVVGAVTAADVQAAVGFAAAHERPVAIQATGHGAAAPCRDGLLLSTHRMRDVRVDPGLRAARLEAGATWGDVVNATAPHGLAPMSPAFPLIGAVGYTLGGGIGVLARRHGHAADHVRSVDLVTADGAFHHVTADGEPELFWALRGGGGNFGAVTALEIDLVPVSRVYVGALLYPASAEVLDAYLAWTATVPDEMSSAAITATFPDLPDVPEAARGRRTTSLLFGCAAGAETGEPLVAPLRSIGRPLMDTMAELPFEMTASVFHEPGDPHGYRGSNALLRGIDSAALRKVFDRTGNGAPVDCVVELRHLGGALARPPAVANAVGHRDAQYMLHLTSELEPRGIETARAFHRQVLQEVEPWSCGVCLNFLYSDDATESVRRAYEPEVYARLASIKAVYDPANLFRFNHNIRPA